MMDYSKIVSYIEAERWNDAERELAGFDRNQVDEIYYILLFHVSKALGRDRSRLIECISAGLMINPRQSELFVCLAELYANNADQRMLCLNQALFYCDNEEDKKIISQMISGLKETNDIHVKPFSVVIVSYNCSDLMKDCIKSLRESCPSSDMEIVAVDNASDDGITEWLREQPDVKLIENKTNTGFAHACNQGVEASDSESDIFFLNNDTYVPLNAIFWLRMGLYEDDKVGASSSISNHAGNGQIVFDSECNTKEAWLGYAQKTNIPSENPYEKKIWLCGFALLIKRSVLDKVGLFDESFGLGYYEDNDLGIRILKEGYHLLLCWNSFILHYGSQSFKRESEQQLNLAERNNNIITQKWGFNIDRISFAVQEAIDLIEAPKTYSIRVLEIGCGVGASLARIKFLWPYAEVCGIETNSDIAALGSKYLNIVQGDIESNELPYETESFDYILCAGVIEQLTDPEDLLARLKKYLKKDGQIIMSISNIMHESVLMPLLLGKLEYSDKGILDRTHLRFFTLNSIIKMMERVDMSIEDIRASFSAEDTLSQQEKMLAGKLTELIGKDFETYIKSYQYFLRASQK